MKKENNGSRPLREELNSSAAVSYTHLDRLGEEEVTELPNLADFCNIRIFLDDEEFRMVQGKTVLYSRRLNLKDGVITRHVLSLIHI